MLLSGHVPYQADLHEFTVINEVRDLEIVSLYVWGAGHKSKGDNRLQSSLQPDSSFTFILPSGKCNILAFDESGNSYGIAGNYQKNVPDTLEIDLEYITFGRPNVDNGYYLLNVANSLNGFALDTFRLSSTRLHEDVILDGFRVFPGNSITIWLDKGIYSVDAVDQIGRTYSAECITVPDSGRVVSIESSMIANPLPPVGTTGNGAVSLFIENCLPAAVITELTIVPQNGSDGIYIDSIFLQPGAHIIAYLNPGFYSILATDEFNAEYFISIEQQATGSLRLPIVDDYLQYDFSFPGNSQE